MQPRDLCALGASSLPTRDLLALALRMRAAGYEVAHHGEGRWNGVAIASRCGMEKVVANFGAPLQPPRTDAQGDDEPLV